MALSEGVFFFNRPISNSALPDPAIEEHSSEIFAIGYQNASKFKAALSF